MALTIAQAVRKLLIREPFYGLFLMGLNKYFDNSVPTACIRRKGINTELAINKEYWDGLDDTTAVNVLYHEISHIIFKHLWIQQDFQDKKKFNIAADCTVNQYISGVPDSWYLPKDFGFENGKGTKWYYENIPDNPNEKIIVDGHDWEDFKNLSEAEKQLINNQIDYQSKATAEQVLKTHGHIPGQLQEYINSLFQLKEGLMLYL